MFLIVGAANFSSQHFEKICSNNVGAAFIIINMHVII